MPTVKRDKRWKRIRETIVWTADGIDPDKVADAVVRVIDRRVAVKERSSPEQQAIREMERYFEERDDGQKD